ncbi:MAG: SURF1 family cytochrome oxidase biogenesis protein [Micromonosporaceae bacterium]
MSHSTSTRPRRYGFLASPGWIALIAVALILAATMVGLGFWQLSRYHERTDINERIAAAGKARPRPVADVLAISKTPPANAAWARVTATGEYDTGHEILVRSRTVSGRVGFEVVTPLVLDDGTAVLVDRGWIPPGEGGAAALPDVPPAPRGEVTVVGRVHLPESGGDKAVSRSGQLQSRRIDPARLASAVDHQLFGGYLLLQRQTPPASGFVPVPIRYENSGQNLSYMVQWWLFSVIALVGPGYLIRREARQWEGRNPEPAF